MRSFEHIGLQGALGVNRNRERKRRPSGVWGGAKERTEFVIMKGYQFCKKSGKEKKKVMGV